VAGRCDQALGRLRHVILRFNVSAFDDTLETLRLRRRTTRIPDPFAPLPARPAQKNAQKTW